ncbi:MAG TPA: GNAT family N-acetyltransferase [Pseudonocardiaceae bacterium]|nr:GNAT family N-acetyltransferase [Pseudonocardiaceae bacterium]
MSERDRVRDRYAALADRIDAGATDDHAGPEHYTDEPDLPVQASLGCGNPVAVVDLHPGETVLDLGSGAGLDVLLSARRVGPTGRAIGLDMTDQMLGLARRHAVEAGVDNVEFLRGHIEDIPLPDGSVDVVISNCVLTLSADKAAVFAQIARVLKPGGRIGISDVLAEPSLTDTERAARADRVECLAGSLTADQHVAHLITAGLREIDIRRTGQAEDKLYAATIRATRPATTRPARITTMTAQHAAGVLSVHQSGLDTGNAGFETTAPDWPTWDAGHTSTHRFVALDQQGQVAGWIAATPVSSHCVHAGVLEHSIYVRPDHHSRGIGTALLDAYIAATEAAGVWTLQTGIFPENQASLALHQRAGFRVVGHRERIGRHDGRWRDVVFIERRTARNTDMLPDLRPTPR